jgi:hypothetical protein
MSTTGLPGTVRHCARWSSRSSPSAGGGRRGLVGADLGVGVGAARGACVAVELLSPVPPPGLLDAPLLVVGGAPGVALAGEVGGVTLLVVGALGTAPLGEIDGAGAD